MTDEILPVAYVVNPVAGHGRGAAVFRDLHLAAGAAGHGGPIHVTRGPGDATVLARRAIDEGAATVVAVGGDGTAGEVAQALAGTGVALAILPAGGGNDVSRVLGVPRLRPGPASLAHAIRGLLAAPRHRLDLLDAGGRLSLQACGAGLDAHVTEARARSRLRPPALAYAAGAITGLLSWKPGPVRVTVDGRVAYDGLAFAVTVANVSTYGGGLKIAPSADPTDGRLDVAIIGDIGRLDAVRLFPSVYRGGHVGHPKFHLVQGATARVEARADPLPVHVDGTVTGRTPLDVRVVGGAIDVAAPDPEWRRVA